MMVDHDAFQTDLPRVAQRLEGRGSAIDQHDQGQALIAHRPHGLPIRPVALDKPVRHIDAGLNPDGPAIPPRTAPPPVRGPPRGHWPPEGPRAATSISQPLPAASSSSPMIEVPDTLMSWCVTVTSASYPPTTVTNLAAARACSPRSFAIRSLMEGIVSRTRPPGAWKPLGCICVRPPPPSRRPRRAPIPCGRSRASPASAG